MSQLSGPQLRALKARAQRLEPILKIGKAGLSDAFFAALETALDQHELVKLKFESFKDQKKELTPQLVERSREPTHPPRGQRCRPLPPPTPPRRA